MAAVKKKVTKTVGVKRSNTKFIWGTDLADAMSNELTFDSLVSALADIKKGIVEGDYEGGYPFVVFEVTPVGTYKGKTNVELVKENK